MSNFLKNLAKRGAGLPISAEYSPRPLTGIETRFGSRERTHEIASEEASDLRHEAPLATLAQPLNVSSTFSPSQAQPPSAMAATTASQPSMPEPTTAFQPPSPGPELFLRPGVAEIAPVPESDQTDETSVRRHELREHNAAAVAASVEPAGQSIHVEGKVPAITWERRERGGLLRPEVSAEAAHENTRLESPADQVIRPAATEPGIPFQFPKVAPAQPQSPATVPIYVRVGRVEVRGTTQPQQEPARSMPKESTPLGFASYHRMRRYRS